MARDWSREPWIKVFPREEGAWLALSWQARGLYRLLQSEAGRDGAIRFGARGTEWVAVVFRMGHEEAANLCDELTREGYLSNEGDGLWRLPHHAAQQETVTSSAERVKRHRERYRVTDGNVTDVTDVTAETLHVTPVTLHPLQVTEAPVTVKHDAVTVKRKEREEREEREDKKAPARAGARERARVAASTPSPSDPRAARLALALAANQKFACLDASAAASELLGGLGALAFALDNERIESAVAQAAAEAESGATERRLRQVLGWKLKDATKVRPQGVDERLAEDVARIQAQVERDQAERDAVAVDYDDDAPF